MRFRKILMFWLLALALVATASSAAFGQKSSHKKGKKKKDEYSLKSHLWYGGNFGLGFNGYLGGSIFSLELSPMVGYKIWGPFSAGPRLGFQYSSFKEQGIKAVNLFSFEPGLFARARIYGPIFAHLEAANEYAQYPDYYDPAINTYTKATSQYFNQYIGLGYNTGSSTGGGTELLVLYNVAAAQDPNYPYAPFNLRFGFTWKF